MMEDWERNARDLFSLLTKAEAERDAALSQAKTARREALRMAAEIAKRHRHNRNAAAAYEQGARAMSVSIEDDIRALLDAPADGKREGE